MRTNNKNSTKFGGKKYWINKQIRAAEVRVIGEENEQLGVMPLEQALNLAMEKGLDLVEVSPLAQPPVCKIIDHGKFQYQQSRGEKKVKQLETKCIRLSLKIGQHDMLVKQKQAEKFLTKGHNIKIELRLKGREKAFTFKGKAIEIIKKFANDLSGGYIVNDKEIQQLGPILSITINKK